MYYRGYVWQPTNPVVAGGDVTVHYQDESGKQISDDDVLKGNVGEPYSSSKKDIKNYTFKEIKGAASGEFTDKAQTVTYVYKENSTPPSKQEVVNVYRLYNKKSMEHLYTADAYEYKHLPELSSDWVREGINFKEYKKSDSTTVTVHRLYNPKSGEHLNTKDSYEVKVLTSKGWKSEGVAFYAPKAGGKPVYRLFNPKAGIGAHLMTADSYEKSVLTKAPKEWKYEGVAWNSVK
ncbi:MucBP domain-containing protein [Lactococcus garvieae]|uniref:MucBP domain-containing protein n=2 Tax=Lactococcus garvieae TaxID=1363 RepID=UPI0020CEA945|nr:MucBP domain-containing protein [Lactococcus garvieae]